MKTFSAKSDEVDRKWYLIDATGKTLGRLAADIASRLRGKHKVEYTPHVDTGDYIVVINAEKIRVTNAASLLAKHPERLIEKAVKGMLPRNPLGRKMFSKLKVFSGPDHDHAAQQPIPLETNI